MLRGERILLRPVKHSDLAQLEAWANDAEFLSEYGTFGLRPVEQFERPFTENGLLTERHGVLLIVSTEGGELLGDISYHQVRHGPNEGSTAYNIGTTLTLEHRYKGYGLEAKTLLVQYLFNTYPIVRIEAVTDAENLPAQRGLEKAGFTREGVLRKAQWRNGQWHDVVIYSKLRGE